MLAGGIGQALDLVQGAVVQRRVDGLPGLLDVGEVHHPAQFRIQGAGDVDLYLERVSMQAGAGVLGGQIW